MKWIAMRTNGAVRDDLIESEDARYRILRSNQGDGFVFLLLHNPPMWLCLRAFVTAGQAKAAADFHAEHRSLPEE